MGISLTPSPNSTFLKLMLTLKMSWVSGLIWSDCITYELLVANFTKLGVKVLTKSGYIQINYSIGKAVFFFLSQRSGWGGKGGKNFPLMFIKLKDMTLIFIIKTSLLHLQNISRNKLLLTSFSALTLIQATIISCLITATASLLVSLLPPCPPTIYSQVLKIQS